MIRHTMTLSIPAISFLFWNFQKILQVFPLPTFEDVMHHELHQTAHAASSDIKGFLLSDTAESFLSH